VSFKDLGTSVSSTLYRQLGRINGRVQNYRSLSVDILENERNYRVVFDAPGAEPDDIQVRYLDGNVRIQIDRFREFHEGYDLQFPGRGLSLSGEAELPADAVVNPDAGTARLSETGTLSVEIPKASALEDTTEADADGRRDVSEDAESGPDTEAVTVDE